jgi:hypothetical protein
MVPIFEETPDGAAGYNFPEFQQRFLEICAEHRTSGRALAFAFLLFDVDSPEIIKMLRDPDYWRALDQISGSYLSVFTLITHQPQSSHQHEVRSLAGVGPVQDPGAKLQLILNSYFGLNEALRLPAVLLFQTEQQAVSGYCLAQLHANGIEPVFDEIRALLRDVAEALGTSISRGSVDSGELFKAIKNRLMKRRAIQFVKDGKKVFDNVRDIASLAGMVT